MPEGNAPLSYGALRDRIAVDLKQVVAERQVSTARLVSDLSSEIRAALERGLGYDDVARVLTQHGVPARADAVRVALRRAGTPTAGQPGAASARQPGRAPQVDAPAQATTPDLQVEANSPESADAPPDMPRQAVIGRHLS